MLAPLVLLLASTTFESSLLADEQGYKPLFNGKNLDGWQLVNTKGNFEVEDGILRMNKGKGWLATKSEYANFDLRIRYRFVTPGADSGVFIRSSLEGDNWTKHGYQIQNMDNQTLGAVVGMGLKVLEPEHDPKLVAKLKKPAGEWMDLRIVARGPGVSVFLNGEPVANADVEAPSGYIGLQAEGGILEFERVEIKTFE